MFIQKLVKEFFTDYTATIYDKNGSLISKETITSNYETIRNYILKTSSPGDTVALMMDYNYQYLLCIYACMEIGVVFLPLRPTWPTARIDQIKALFQFKYIIDDQVIHDILLDKPNHIIPNPSVKPDDTLYIICTSGSTGEPKGVVIKRNSYENFLRWLQNTFSYIKDDYRWLITPDFSVDMSLTDAGLFLLNKHTLFFSQFSGNLFKLAYEIMSYKINGLNTVPNNFNMLTDPTIIDKFNLNSLRDLFIAGSRFSLCTYQNLFRCFSKNTNIYNMYGPTEITVLSHYKKLSGDVRQDLFETNVSIGKPFAGVTCLLADEKGNEIKTPYEIGELYLGGVQVMHEYINKPDLTQKTITTISGVRYYKSGDIAFFDNKSEFYITGRKDYTIKRRGYRIDLLDIDSYIQKISFVQDCTTIAVPDEKRDHILVTFVILKSLVSEKLLLEEMSKILVNYQIPDYVEFIKSFPTNNAGKIDRNALEQNFLSKNIL